VTDQPRRPRIDWAAALAYFLALPPHQRTFASVAARFGVSDTAVRNHARKHGWDAAAAELDRQAAADAMRKARRTRAQRIEQALRLVDGTMDAFEEHLPAKAAEAKISDLPALVKLAELLEGEATDRIDVSQARALVNVVFQVAGRFVPADQREVFLQEMDAAVGGLLQLGDEAGG
jgi:tRNA A37 N6-isopentenylltransferase MiaA